jgi:hypothetical protein
MVASKDFRSGRIRVETVLTQFIDCDNEILDVNP